VNGILVEEGVERYTHGDEHAAISTSAFRLTMRGSASHVTLVCFVEGMQKKLQIQKLVQLKGDLLAIYLFSYLLPIVNLKDMIGKP
jgi:hypothetical protein